MFDWKKMSGLFLACWLAVPGWAQVDPNRLSPPERYAFYLREAATAYGNDAIPEWVAATEKLHELKPFNQDFMRHLVQGYAQLGQTSNAFSMMLKMQQQGLSEDWSQFDAVDDLRQHSLYDHLSELMTQAGQPFGQADVFATLDGDRSMPEAIAFDAQTQRLFVGTIREGEIWVYEPKAQTWSLFADVDQVPDLMSVYSMAVDQDRGVLWVAAGVGRQYRYYRSESFGRTALIKLDLATGKPLSTHRLVPDGRPHLLGSIDVADDGTVYATDALLPLVYRLAPEDTHPTLFFGSSALTSLRGIAVDDDKQKLYVADYDQGIVVLDLSGGNQAWQLAIPETLNLGGIDGLYASDGSLIAIQNGIAPDRVLRLQLGSDGLGVVAVTPVVAALEAFDSPNYGAMDGTDLYMFANSHWAYVDETGRPIKRPMPDVTILKVDTVDASLEAVGEAARRQLGGQR